jgi:hypothetical protein
MVIRTSDDVHAVLRLFEREPGGRVALADGLVQLSGELHIRRAKGENVGELHGAVSRLTAEHSTLLTILERSEWQKVCARTNQLDGTLWFYFAALDVEHFYVSMRSLFDHLAQVCACAAVQPGQCPRMFHELLSWCSSEPRAKTILGVELIDLVTGCTWFDDIRNTRDGIVHFGALTIAFPSFETVSFNVYGGNRSAVVPSALMTNENIADFELYMAWTLGNVGLTVDRLGKILLSRLAGDNRLQTRSIRPGYATLFGYLERLAERLSQRKHEGPNAPGT